MKRLTVVACIVAAAIIAGTLTYVAIVGGKRVAETRGGPASRPSASAANAPATAPALPARFVTESVSTSKGHGFLLTGTVAEGTLRTGQAVTVHAARGPVKARIERIESTDGRYAELSQAPKGQTVSLFFQNSKELSLLVPDVTEGQISQGTIVTSDEP